MSDIPETDAALRPSGLRAIADGLLFRLGQGHQPDAFFVADVLRVAAGKLEELQSERNVVHRLPRTWGAEYTDALNLLKEERDQWRECAERLAGALWQESPSLEIPSARHSALMEFEKLKYFVSWGKAVTKPASDL